MNAMRAAKNPLNLTVGAGALFASVALVNPLPLILYAAGSLLWVYDSARKGRYSEAIINEERRAGESEADAERRTLLQEAKAILATPLFANLRRRSQIPDYIARYDELVAIRNEVAQNVRARPEVERPLEDDILRQMDYMLTAYLRLLKPQIAYLRILIGTIPGSPTSTGVTEDDYQDVDDDHGLAHPFVSEITRKLSNRNRRIAVETREPGNRAQLPNSIPTVDERVAALEARIADLKKRAEEQPSTAQVRQTHIELLEKQCELLRECHESQQRVEAQLEAFPDAFRLILARVSASQFVPSGVVQYIGEVVNQVDDTIRFAEAVRPSMDRLFEGANVASAT
jgi:hypothetical protein